MGFYILLALKSGDFGERVSIGKLLCKNKKAWETRLKYFFIVHQESAMSSEALLCCKITKIFI